MASVKTTLTMYNEGRNVFTGIGCFKGTFLLQVTDDVKPYQVPIKCIAYALQELLRKELESLQDLQILAPPGTDETEVLSNTLLFLGNCMKCKHLHNTEFLPCTAGVIFSGNYMKCLEMQRKPIASTLLYP